MSSNSKHTKESKNSTKPETTEGTDASPAGTFSILTLRSVIVLVVILCVAIQFYSPWTTTQLFDTFLNAGNTDRASPSTQTGAAGETRTSGSGGKDGWASSTEKVDSSSVPLASSSPVMFGTSDPQPSSAPLWSSSSREDTQDSHRQKHRRNESPFQDFFDQSNCERSKAPEVACNQYLCRETGTCVSHPIECPCLYEHDTKCMRGDWYSCHRGTFDCRLLS